MNLVTISDNKDLHVDLLDYGARIVGVRFAGTDVALAYSEKAQYLVDPFYLGATVGPICNRIAGAKLNIEGKDFYLPANEGDNCLHSGGQGFDKQYWELESSGDDFVEFKLHYQLSAIGLQGYLLCIARYQVNDGALTVKYTTQSSHACYVNITNHVYLNLSGAGGQAPITDHVFEINASSFVNIDNAKIPDGSLTEIPAPFSYQLNTKNRITEFSELCDHHFNVRDKRMIRVSCLNSDIILEVSGDAPGFQFYTGKYLSDPFAESAGFCVETQYAPDAINQPNFYSPVLTANEVRSNHTEFKFSRS